MTWDPTQPPANSPLLSAPIRENFQALDGLMAGGVMNPMTALGDLIVGAALGVPARLGIGGDGTVLTVVGGVPGWQAPTLPPDVGFANPMTGVGELIRGGASGVATRLAPGTNGHILTLAAGVPAWAAPVAGAPAYPLLAPDGTAAAPSYAFASQPVMGLYLNASGEPVLKSNIGSGKGVHLGADANVVVYNAQINLGAPGNMVSLYRDANHTFAQRLATNPQTFRLYNTFTDAANGEWLEATWNVAANNAVLRAMANGTGTVRDLRINHSGLTSIAVRVVSTVDGGLSLVPFHASSAALTTGRVLVGSSSSVTATSGTTRTFRIGEAYSPTATSTLVAIPLEVNGIINYSNATPGAGSYEALKIAVTETALPTGQSYMIRASGGAAGTTDVFSVLRDGEIRGLSLRYTVRTAPATPAAGTGIVYLKSDNKLYFKSDAGVETALW